MHWLLIVMALAIAGPGTADLESRARAAMIKKLKDPRSAEFIELRERQTEKATFICGQVNSKNSFGAYIGFTPFAIHENVSVTLVDPTAEPIVRQMQKKLIDLMCDSPSSSS